MLRNGRYTHAPVQECRCRLAATFAKGAPNHGIIPQDESGSGRRQERILATAGPTASSGASFLDGAFFTTPAEEGSSSGSTSVGISAVASNQPAAARSHRKNIVTEIRRFRTESPHLLQARGKLAHRLLNSKFSSSFVRSSASPEARGAALVRLSLPAMALHQLIAPPPPPTPERPQKRSAIPSGVSLQCAVLATGRSVTSSCTSRHRSKSAGSRSSSAMGASWAAVQADPVRRATAQVGTGGRSAPSTPPQRHSRQQYLRQRTPTLWLRPPDRHKPTQRAWLSGSSSSFFHLLTRPESHFIRPRSTTSSAGNRGL